MNTSPIDAIRSEQIAIGRQISDDVESPGTVRRTLSLSRTYDGRAESRSATSAPRKINAPARVPLKGHEAFLKALELSGADVVIEKVSSGEAVEGKLKHSDKYTVTIRSMSKDDKLIDRVIFKHDISEFYTTTARPEVEFEAGLPT